MPASSITKKYKIADMPAQAPLVPAGRLRRRRSIIGNALKAVGGAACSGALVAACDGGGNSVGDSNGLASEETFLPALVDGKMSLPLDEYPMLKAVGGVLQGTAAGIGSVFIVQEEEGKFVAASGMCTHMACPLRYNGLNHTFDCGCHGSTFETDGTVVTGPAKKTLPTYAVDFDGKALTVRVR